MNARKSTFFLYLIGKLKPAAWDAIIPHGPKVSLASREYMIAMALKGFSAEVKNRAVAKKIASIQQVLVKFASERLAQDFGDDDWCGTSGPKRFPFPIPDPDPIPWFSFSDVMLNPQPLPPKDQQKEIGGYLLMLSEATTLESVAKDLQSVGNGLIRG